MNVVADQSGIVRESLLLPVNTMMRKCLAKSYDTFVNQTNITRKLYSYTAGDLVVLKLKERESRDEDRRSRHLVLFPASRRQSSSILRISYFLEQYDTKEGGVPGRTVQNGCSYHVKTLSLLASQYQSHGCFRFAERISCLR